MDTLHIRSFQARHRVPDDDAARRSLGVQQQLLDGELQAALAGASGGAADDAVIVVRRLQARMTLSARHTEADNARRWSDAIAAQFERALRHAPARDLLHFAHRRQALQAFVGDMLGGQTGRDWAWQRLGWLPGPAGQAVATSARRSAMLRLLADDTELSVPLLHRLLRSPLWPGLIDALADGELQGLAASVLARMAGPAAVPFGAASPALAGPLETPPWVDGAWLPGWSDIVAATWRAAGAPARRLWALRLAWMLADAPLARRGAAAVDAALVRAWAGTAAGAEPAAAGTGHDDAPHHSPAAPEPTDAMAAPVRAADDATPGIDSAATTGWTDHGGLLLLLPLLPASGALALLEDPAVWPHDDQRWALHRCALHLQPLAADDAAALAFCGLPPGAAPPSPGRVPDTAQLTALAAAREQLQALLSQRLPDWRGPALLQRVARRRARIVADPGWIDVHFALRDVSLELRRAAIDLDPGFIPWLGIVLRFVYD